MSRFANVIINRKSPAVDRIFTYVIPQHLQGKVVRGMLCCVPFNREQLEAVIVRLHDEQPDGFAIREISSLLSEKPLFSDELLALSEWLSDYYLCSRAAALQAMLPAGMTLSGRAPQVYLQTFYRLTGQKSARLTAKRAELRDYLIKQGESDVLSLLSAGFSRNMLHRAEQDGLIVSEQRRVTTAGENWSAEPTLLSAQQQRVLEQIFAERQGHNRPFLLHGITGSGKTELYLRLIDQAAKQGKQSIVLVPEITLSTQMVEMMTRRLSLPLAVLHSGLKQTERRHIWQQIAEGRIDCVVGARSAVFAPLPRLGQIIIDEAHESSYKQDNTPRFSALTVAEKRAQLTGASLLIGSATPAVEQFYAAQKGIYAYGTLTSHYYQAPPPKVEIVDMRTELKSGNKSIFSRSLIDSLDETLACHEQAILFINRRGYYQHFSCRECGSVITCPHCAVAMSFHEDRYGGRLKCHYCGRSIEPPNVCPTCGSTRIRKFGIGTQRVADELTRLYPTARIARLDSDVTAERGAHDRIYHDMRAGKYDILVGTQIVAKGLDFPRLKLAAVVSADIMLNLPDWRAAERTFQLITQLIGRAGRRDTQGRAIIQTYTPEAMPIQAAADGDYLSFYQAELLERELHGYPPFKHLVRVLGSSCDHVLLRDALSCYTMLLRPLLTDDMELCGPADAPLVKLKDRFRRQVIIKCCMVDKCTHALAAAENQLRATERLPRDFLLTVDVDPFGVM